MSKIQKGKNLMVSIGTTIYGFATSCDLSVDVDTKEISTGSYKHQSTSGQWKEYDTERIGWTVNSEHLATVGLEDEKALFAQMTAGQPVNISFEEVTSATGETGDIEGATTKVGFSGKAIITSLKLSAQNDSDATFSISLQGTGVLAQA